MRAGGGGRGARGGGVRGGMGLEYGRAQRRAHRRRRLGRDEQHAEADDEDDSRSSAAAPIKKAATRLLGRFLVLRLTGRHGAELHAARH